MSSESAALADDVHEDVAEDADLHEEEPAKENDDLDKDHENLTEKEDETEGENEKQERSATPPPLDYEEQLEKYGWRMQVPGDPLNLKTPCLPKRHPYTVKCEVPATPAAPPDIHTENYETFFYNTIPQRPLSFVIHKEWVSEVIHGKRMDLQKREGGIKYRYKNFSFIY